MLNGGAALQEQHQKGVTIRHQSFLLLLEIREIVLTLLTVLSDSRTKVLLNSSLLNFFTVFWPLKPNQTSHAEDALKLF